MDKFPPITCNFLKAWRKSHVQVAIRFASRLLKNWREILIRSLNVEQSHNSFLQSFENSSIGLEFIILRGLSVGFISLKTKTADCSFRYSLENRR